MLLLISCIHEPLNHLCHLGLFRHRRYLPPRLVCMLFQVLLHVQPKWESNVAVVVDQHTVITGCAGLGTINRSVIDDTTILESASLSSANTMSHPLPPNPGRVYLSPYRLWLVALLLDMTLIRKIWIQRILCAN